MSSSAIAGIAHDWANRIRPGGVAGHVYYEGDCIFSYGRHFMIARHVQNDRGERAVLFTTRIYSRTTSAHTTIVDSASSHLHKIYVPEPSADQEELFAGWHRQMVNLARRLENAKRPGRLLTAIRSVFKEAQQYADFFGYAIPLSLVDMGAVTSLEQFQAHLANEKALQAAEEAEKRKAALRRHARQLKAWRAFDTDDFNGRNGWDYLRCNYFTERIETSQQVEIPFGTGHAFYRQILSVIEAGGCKVCGIQFMKWYPVLAINKNYVRVGCHKISLAEITRIAKRLAWI